MSTVITSADFPIDSCVLVDKNGIKQWFKLGARMPKICTDQWGLTQFNAWEYQAIPIQPPKK